MRRRWPAALAVAVAVVMLAAACGGTGDTAGIASLEGDSESTTSTTTAAAAEAVDPEQAMLDYAACMRENGVDMEDPTVDENGNFQIMRPSGGGEGGEFSAADRDTMRGAREACSQYLEGITQQFELPDTTEMQDLMLEYAACMRENGIDMEDPDFTGDGPGMGGRLGFDPGDYDPSDPTFEAANEICQEIFGAAGMPGMMMGGGPGGGTPPQGGTPPDGGSTPDDGTTLDTIG